MLALQATALDGADTSVEGFAALGLAQNWDDFLAAARTHRLADAERGLRRHRGKHRPDLAGPRADPAQGRRLDAGAGLDRRSSTGRASCRSTTCRALYNPASGIIVNANARLVPDDYRHFITRDWAEPYRQRRANQLLREVERHPVYGMIVIQADNLTLDAADMLPVLLKPDAAQCARRQGARHAEAAGTASCWRAGPSR